ncbi:hypothetical protein COT72_02030 [archaeon CG10_big_fil_rev_8_21_14_0_10_43_11]|nr:MAG: hypothetical protein COT72_02030 [archaeon CG10_big_fil_rev_8_21_14_0_10_43_11]
MKLAFVFLALFLLAGCTQLASSDQQNLSDQTKFSDCLSFCQAQPHIQCVGEWDVTGVIPNCQCNYVCAIVQ